MSEFWTVNILLPEAAEWRSDTLHFSDKVSAEGFARLVLQAARPGQAIHLVSNNDADSLLFVGNEPLVGQICDASVFAQPIDSLAARGRMIADAANLGEQAARERGIGGSEREDGER